MKRFGSVLALDAVDFELGGGEVMALVGDNGERGGWHLRGLRQVSVARDPDE